MLKSLKTTVILGIILLVTSKSYGQYTNSNDLESIFYNPKYGTLQQYIKEASKKQALYAYNIANLSVPGFKPILPKEDQAILDELATQKGYSNEVLVEFLMSRMTENSKRYNAYLAMWKGKTDALKRIVSMGK